MRKSFRTTVFALLLLVAAAPSFAADAAKRHVTIVFGGDGMHLLPIYVALGAGLFAAEGLDVDWVNVGSGTRQAAAVSGGSAELTPMSLTHVITAQAEGADLVAVARVFDVYANSVFLSNDAMQRSGIRPDMPINEKVARMKGLKIGISSPGSSTDEQIRALLLARGLDPDRHVTLIPVGTGTAMLAAFQRHLTDGFVYVAPIPEIADQRGLGKVVVDPFSGEVPELIDVPYVVLATSQAVLKTRATEVAAARRALVRATTFASEHPAETAAILRKYFPDVDPDIFARVAEQYRRATPKDPTLTLAQVAKTLAWMNLGAPTPLAVNPDQVIAKLP